MRELCLQYQFNAEEGNIIVGACVGLVDTGKCEKYTLRDTFTFQTDESTDGVLRRLEQRILEETGLRPDFYDFSNERDNPDLMRFFRFSIYEGGSKKRSQAEEENRARHSLVYSSYEKFVLSLIESLK